MIRWLGEDLKEEVIIQKLYRYLPMRFNAKILAIEEMINLKNLTMDQLQGTLTTYAKRLGNEKTKPKEETFKVSKKTKEDKYHQEFSNYEFDREMAHFSKNLKLGSGMYKGNLTFKCFDCWRVRNFTSKFPHKGNIEKDKDQNTKDKAWKYQKKKSFKKEGLYSKGDSSTSEANTEYSSKGEPNECLLMAFEANSKYKNDLDLEEEDEGVVDLEGEIITSLDELKNARK